MAIMLIKTFHGIDYSGTSCTFEVWEERIDTDNFTGAGSIGGIKSIQVNGTKLNRIAQGSYQDVFGRNYISTDPDAE